MLAATGEGILRPADQDVVLDLVRRSVALGLNDAPPHEPLVEYHSPALRRQCASTVTLRQNGQVIGYAGTIESTSSLISDVCHNAYEAARHGAQRSFGCESLTVDVCLVREAECVNAHSLDEVCDKLTVGKHGVLLHHSAGAATMTPDKWNETPEPYDFMRQLCDKADVACDDWPDDMHAILYRTEALPTVEVHLLGNERPSKPH
ncbi:MAG: AMMECR1 domain-containing protein [Aureliella sp.]